MNKNALFDVCFGFVSQSVVYDGCSGQMCDASDA